MAANESRGVYGFGSLDKDGSTSALAIIKNGPRFMARTRYRGRYSVSPDANLEITNDVTSGNTFPGNIASSTTGDTLGNPLQGNCGPIGDSPFFNPNVCV